MALILDGLLGETFPSWTTATRPSSPANGQTGFNSTLSYLETYNGSSWVAGGLPVPSTSGNVLTSDGTNWTSSTGVVGVGQTWQNVTSTRTSGTTYTNSTSKPIFVLISFASGYNGSGSSTVVVGGVTISSNSCSSASGLITNYTASFIVPVSSTYVCTASGVTSIQYWSELR